MEGNEEIVLHFPRSVVIYPEKNDAIPDHLRCRIIFQDNSEHIYKVPTVKIQAYSLKEIKEKHLALLIPYTILRLRPRLEAGRKLPLTQKELTEFVEEVILGLKEELSDGYLTEREYSDYVRLFYFAANRVLEKHPQMREEVNRMTEPLIKLPSMIEDELRARIADQEAEIADQKMQLAGKDEELESKEAELKDKEAELKGKEAELKGKEAELKDKEAELKSKDTELKSKDTEIQRLQKLILQLTSGKNTP